MTFSDRYFSKIIEFYEQDNPHMAAILRNQGSLEQAIITLTPNALKSISSLVGRDFGARTKEKVLEGRELSSKEEVLLLQKSFHEHMLKRGINVSYILYFSEQGLPEEMSIIIDNCVFDVESMPCRFCSYSQCFLETYFNAEVNCEHTIEQGSNECYFNLSF